MQITITINNDQTITVCGPYSELNNTAYRALGGKYVSPKGWILPDNDTVRAKLAELFGGKSEIVDALVPADKIIGTNIVQIGGYVLASRRTRDSQVTMPEGVSLHVGSFARSGGSVKNPRIGDLAGVVFRLSCRQSFAVVRQLELCTPKLSQIDI